MTDYRGNAPYNNFKEHKMKYRKGFRGEAQRTIGERPERGNPGIKILAKAILVIKKVAAVMAKMSNVVMIKT